MNNYLKTLALACALTSFTFAGNNDNFFSVKKTHVSEAFLPNNPDIPPCMPNAAGMEAFSNNLISYDLLEMAEICEQTTNLDIISDHDIAYPTGYSIYTFMNTTLRAEVRSSYYDKDIQTFSATLVAAFRSLGHYSEEVLTEYLAKEFNIQNLTIKTPNNVDCPIYSTFYLCYSIMGKMEESNKNRGYLDRYRLSTLFDLLKEAVKRHNAHRHSSFIRR